MNKKKHHHKDIHCILLRNHMGQAQSSLDTGVRMNITSFPFQLMLDNLIHLTFDNCEGVRKCKQPYNT